MIDYEKLGQFYLGRRYDAERAAPTEEPILYDAKHLTTHAVCLGMTGSGKTGLGLTLLEEAAIDGIPAIAIDPKGDLGNLLLTFPQLQPEDFRPWVDPAEAERRSLTPDQLAQQTAETWRKGLAEWDQQPDRIERFRSAAETSIYTPGSSSGMPLAVFRSLSAPGTEFVNDTDALRERVESSATALLTLVGIDADPLRSREHILLSNILDSAWRRQQNLDLPGLIQLIQKPPFDKVGVMDLDTFFAPKDRFALAMGLNNLLGSPAFAAWSQGEPLSVQNLLYTPSAKPRLSILSIAHLSDAQRMFFVTLLLNELITWMRLQQGTSSLRAILYMDEVFGYLPPTANPPSKQPMLTLLKQARAFGLGIVLASQNPVDLDYKALSNAGTWFIGRLQTERDKERVLDGLEGASASAAAQFDRRKIATTLSSLRSRVFLLNDAHADEPLLFQTRWTLSYLRGPLTKKNIEMLMQARKGQKDAPSLAQPSAGQSAGSQPISSQPQPPKMAPPPAPPPSAAVAAGTPPALPPDIPQVFFPPSKKSAGAELIYRPTVLGMAKLHFKNAKAEVDTWRDVALRARVDGQMPTDYWESAEMLEAESLDTELSAPERARFLNVPADLSSPRQLATWSTRLKEYLYRTEFVRVWRSPELKETSQAGESESAFRIRMSHEAREHRDERTEKIRQKYATKIASLEDRLRRARERVTREKSQSRQKTLQAAISMGAAVLAALTGRRVATSANATRAASAARAAAGAAREQSDIGSAEENAEAVEQQLAALNAELQSQIEQIQAETAPDRLPLETLDVRPRKTDIVVEKVVLAWVPEQA